MGHAVTGPEGTGEPGLAGVGRIEAGFQHRANGEGGRASSE